MYLELVAGALVYAQVSGARLNGVLLYIVLSDSLRVFDPFHRIPGVEYRAEASPKI